MKKLIFPTILILLLLLITGQAFAFQNEPDGFRGIKWGTDIKDLKGFEYLNAKGGLDTYFKHDDKLKIGNAKLSGILYKFYKNKFISVGIYAKDFESGRDLLEACTDVWGKVGENNFIDKGNEVMCWWFGETTGIVFNWGTSKIATLIIYSEKLNNQYMTEKKNKIKSDF